MRTEENKCDAIRELLPSSEDEEAVKGLHEHREKLRRKIKISIASSVLAVVVLLCLWYTLVPRSWADISRDAQIKSLNGYYDCTDEVSYINDDPAQGGIYTISKYRIQDMDSSNPAAQVIIRALEGRSYREYLGNLRPGLLLPDSVSVPGADEVSFYLRTQNRGPMLVSIYSNGRLTIGGLTSMTPAGCLSYQTDTGLFQEVFEIAQEYSTYEYWQGVIEPH